MHVIQIELSVRLVEYHIDVMQIDLSVRLIDANV